jgi:hypothetical protein
MLVVMRKIRVRHFQEGRACDAVLRLLEYQTGDKRQNLRFPEREGHKFPVDLVCELNGVLVALEHTGTEPFEGHVKLQAEAGRRGRPLVDAVASRLPPDQDFDLEVPHAFDSNAQEMGRPVRLPRGPECVCLTLQLEGWRRIPR